MEFVDQLLCTAALFFVGGFALTFPGFDKRVIKVGVGVICVSAVFGFFAALVAIWA